MERRRYKRVKLFVTARFGREGEAKTYFGSIVDVSYSGLFIMTPLTFRIGEKIWIECTFEEKTIRLNGSVARTKMVDHPQLVTYAKGGIGVLVNDMHPEIMKFIDSRLEKEGRFV